MAMARIPELPPRRATAAEFDRLHTPSGLAYSRLVLAMLHTSARMTAAGDELARQFGLSASRWLVMGAIREGGRSVSEIARDRGLTRQSVQEIVNDMVRRRLVSLSDSPEDKRVKLVALTETGFKLFSALTERWAQRVNRLSRGFDKAALATAREVIERLAADVADIATDETKEELRPRRRI
jgi:DNA-binding MarR family transcriptional regulator